MKTLRKHIDMRINRLHFCLILIQSVLNMVEHGQPWSKSGSDQKLLQNIPIHISFESLSNLNLN